MSDHSNENDNSSENAPLSPQENSIEKSPNNSTKNSKPIRPPQTEIKENAKTQKKEKKETKRKKIPKWTTDEDNLLLSSIKEFGLDNWAAVASNLPFRDHFDCKMRYYNHLDPTIDNKPFTIEEDVLVLKKIEVLGKKWIEISKCLPGKTPHAVHLRYKNHLKNLKGDDDSSSSTSGSDDDDHKPDEPIKQLVPDAIIPEPENRQ
ncbi:trichome differentiation protein GL1, putative [Entamoeba invadens IP1]|uniref:Trichome differentiation protein GL1, putative n=1 Tax=Entamoeba invadens IP1 TaxID=370355 RepID=A0A0A1U6Z0_ENTIV|nr:trichome differentiation protein GL1, putative [Entamoeba invadens IP1]ELP90090.1 trichome differentiation protein GL1, putative [Entamoeba invadens IP1]|eukprot:XP_004256861.1 trichome differentiation protein GL1, putative [Entamoeba invadens IP1]